MLTSDLFGNFDPIKLARHQLAVKHALLIGVTDEHPEQRFRPAPSLAAMEGLLGELGGWATTRVDGTAASREGILAELARLQGVIGPDDACLVYFVGHGGIVEIRDLDSPLGGRRVFYLAAARPTREWSFEAVLDIELSLRLALLDRACGNVSVILDCCYSAITVRSPIWQLDDSPEWLRRLAQRIGDRDVDDLLSPTSHPWIVRLAASSSLREAFPDAFGGSHLGRLTQLFVEAVREADLRVDRLTWDALAHHVREQAIWRLGCEDQWVSLAGPRQRLAFSKQEIALPYTVGFVPREDGKEGWIRAGELQGVRIGDEWGLAELALDDELRPRWRGHMRVVETDLNRSALKCVAGDLSAPPGTSAHLLLARQRAPVLIDGRAALHDAVTRSAWIEPGAEQTPATLGVLSSRDGSVDVRSHDDLYTPARFPEDERGIGAAVRRLEDWARSGVLLAVARAHHNNSEGPFAVQLGRHCIEAQMTQDFGSETRPRLHVGDRIFLRIARGSDAGEWFVTAVTIDVAGRPVMLDASEPDGRQVLAGETVILGWRAHRRLQGVELTWPEGTPLDRPRPVTVVVLASRRPLQLGHLVHGSVEGLFPRPVRRARTRVRAIGPRPRPRTGPEPARDGAVVLVQYLLDPTPRSPTRSINELG